MKKIITFFLLLAVVFSDSPMRVMAPSQPLQIGTCMHFTSDRQSCLQCINHYHLFEGQCYRDIHGCKQYIFGSICQKCESGFILVNNECCDHHCMSRIFKNYQESSMSSQESESEKIQRLTIEGYEKTVAKLIKTVIINVNYQFVSTSNQLLLEYIRYTIKIMINHVLYQAIADFSIETGEVTVLEFRPETQIIQLSEVILKQKQVLSNEKSKKAFQYVTSQYAMRIFDCSLAQISVTQYKFANQYKFIYLNSQPGKQIAYIFTVVVSRGSTYSPWMEERSQIKQIQKLIQNNLNVIKVQQNPNFQTVKNQIVKTNEVTSTEIIVKTAEVIQENTFEYSYVNKKTGQVFQETAEVDPVTRQVKILSHKEIISTDLKNIKLPETPETLIITKENVSLNEEIKETIKYLEKTQPSLANKEITNAEIQVIGDIHKITLMQKKDNKTTRVVVLKDERTEKMTLIDESVVEVKPPKKTVIKTTEERTKKITTNDIKDLIRMDENVEEVILKTKETLPNIDFELIEVAEKEEGNLVNTYTFVVDTDKDKVGDFKHQVTVIENKQTHDVKVVDVEELESKPIYEVIKRPVVNLPNTQFETFEIKNIVSKLEQTRPELKTEKITVEKVTKQDKKFVNKYAVLVKRPDGQSIIVTANENLGDQQIKITDIEETKVIKQVAQPYIQKVSVNKNTGVRTTVTNKRQEIVKTFVTETALEEIKTVKVKPTVEEIVSIKNEEYETTVVQTVVIKTQKPQQYLQVTYQKPKDSAVVTYVGEQIVTFEKEQPVIPITSVRVINEEQFTQVIKTDKVLQTVTEKIAESEPVLENVTPIDTQIEDNEDFQNIILVYENPETSEKQRVVTQYSKQTKKVILKETVQIPEEIPEIVVEKDVLPDGHVKIVSNSVEEIIKQDTYVTQVIRTVQEKYPEIKENIVNVQVVQNPQSNNYIIVTKDKPQNQIISIDVNFDKETKEIDWVDVQEIPERQILSQPRTKPVLVFETTKEIEQSTVIQQIIPQIEVSTSETIKTVEKVTQTKSTHKTNYQLQVVTAQGTKETITVLVDNNDSTDVTVIDVTPEVQPPIIRPPAPTTTVTTVDAANVIQTITDNQEDFNNYLQYVIQAAENQQPLLQDQEVTCYMQEEFDQIVEIVYLAKTTWGTIKVVGVVNKQQTNDVIIISVPSSYEGQLESTSQETCQQINKVMIKHSTISLVAERDESVQQLINFVSQNYQTSKIQWIEYLVSYNERVFVVVYTHKTTTFRIVLSYVSEQFNELQAPFVISIQQPKVLEVTTDEDGSTTVKTNDFQQIRNIDQSYQQVITQVTQDYPSVVEQQIINVVSTSNPTNNQYTFTVQNPEGSVSTVQAFYKKQKKEVIITEMSTQPPRLITIQPRPAKIVPKEEFTSETIKTVIQKVQNNQSIKVKPFTVEDTTQIKKIESTFGTNYEITYETPQGPQIAICVKDPKTQEVKIIDYKPVEEVVVFSKPIKTDYYVEQSTGIEVQQTNDVSLIEKNTVVQNVKKVLIEQNRIEPSVKIVETITKKTQNKVQTTLITETSEPKMGSAIVTVYDTNTQETQFLTEKPVLLTTDKVVKIGQIFPSTTISKTAYKEIIQKDKVMQKTVQTIVQEKPELKNVEPSTVVVNKYGHKTITTFSYDEQKVMTVVESDEDTQTIKVLQTYEKPEVIEPIVFETQVSQTGTFTTITNKVQKIIERQPEIQQILSQVKVKVPELMTEQIVGIKMQEKGHINKIYLVSKTEKVDEKEENVQVTLVYDTKTKEHTLMDVQQFSHEEIATKKEKVVTVKLSTTEIKEEKLEQIIVQQSQLTKIPGVQSVVEAEQIVTGYAKIFNVKVKGTNGQQYIVKTEIPEGDEPQIIDVVEEKETMSSVIYTEETTNSQTGMVQTITNDPNIITNDRYYSRWMKYLDDNYQIKKQGYQVTKQKLTSLQRLNQYQVTLMNSVASQSQLIKFTVDRTNRITVLEKKTVSSTEEVEDSQSTIEITESHVSQAIKKFPIVDSSIKILQNADYTYENKKPSKVFIKKYDKNTEAILIFTSPSDPSRNSRVVLMAETSEGASVSEPTRIPKILDISTIPKQITNLYTKNIIDEYGRTIKVTNNIDQLMQNQQFVDAMKYCESHLEIIIGAKIEQVEITQYSFANEYKVTLFNGKEDMILIVSVDKEGKHTIIDFSIISAKSGVEKIPIKPVKTVTTVIPAEKYAQEDIQIVKKQVLKQFNIQDVQIKNVILKENQRVGIYSLTVETPEKQVKQFQVIKDSVEETYKITETTTIKKEIRKPESRTVKYIEPETSFVTESTTDVVAIQSNPIIKTVATYLVSRKVVTQTFKIIETITKTSENTVETTVMTEEPEMPNKAIMTIYNKKQQTVEIVGEKIVPVVKNVPVPTLQKVLTTTVINKEVYTKVATKDNVIKSVQTEIVKNYPQLDQEVPETVTQVNLDEQILTTSTYTKSKVVTKVITDRKTMKSKVVTEEPIEELPKQKIITTIDITEEGREVVTTNNIKELKTIEPKFINVIEKLTTNYEIKETSIKNVKTTQTYNGKIYDVVLDQGDNSYSQLQILTNNNEPEIQVCDFISVPEQQVLQTAEPVICVQVSPQQVNNDQQIQNVIQVIKGEPTFPKITEVKQVKVKPSQLSTLYEITTQTQQGEEIVTVTVDEITEQVTIIDHRPIVQQVIKPAQHSVTTTTVDQVTGIKTTVTTNTQVIDNDTIIQKARLFINQEYPQYDTWRVISVQRQDFPTDQTVQLIMVLQSGSQTVQFILLYSRSSDSFQLLDRTEKLKNTTEASEIKYEMNKRIIVREHWQQAAQESKILRLVRQFISDETQRFIGVIPEKVVIEEFVSLKRFVFVFEQNGNFYEVLVLFYKLSEKMKIFGEIVQIKYSKPSYLETTVSENGKVTTVGNDLSEIIKVYQQFPETLDQLNQQTVINQEFIKNVKIEEVSTGEKYTIITEQEQTITEVQFIRNAKTNIVKIIDQAQRPKPIIFKPQPRPAITVPSEDFTSETITNVITQIQKDKYIPVQPLTTEEITSITKVETAFGETYTVNYETPKGPETTVVTYNPETTVIKVIDHIAVPEPQQPETKPSITQVFVEPINGIKIQETTNIKIIKQNPVVQKVKQVLVKQSVIPVESEVIETQTSTSETKVTTKILTTSKKQPDVVKAVVTVYDKKTEEVQVIGEKQVIVKQTIPKIKEVFPHTVYTETIYQQIIKKDKVLVSAIEQVTDKHPELIKVKPDTISIDQINDKVVTTVTYEQQKVVSQVVTDTTTMQTKEIDTFVIEKEKIKPIILETITTQTGKTTLVSNDYNEIIKAKPEAVQAIQYISQTVPVKTQEIKTIEVTGNQYTIITKATGQNVIQTNFYHQPEEQEVYLLDYQEVTEPIIFSKPKQIVYQVIEQNKPETQQIIKQIQVLNSTNKILKDKNVKQIVKVEKASTNFVEEYRTEILTTSGETGKVFIEVEDDKPHMVDIVLYDPKQEIEETIQIVETTNPRTDVVEIVYPDLQLFKIDEGYAPITEFLEEQTKTHVIQSIIKEEYGQNNEYKVLLKSPEHSPIQIDLNINTFNGEITVMENKTIVSKEITQSTVSKQLPEPQVLVLSPVEQENVMIISKLSTIKDIEEYDEVQDVKTLEKDEQFVEGVQKVKGMYPSLLSSSVIAKVLKKDGLDEEEFRIFFTKQNNDNLYESVIVTNRITGDNTIKNFIKIGDPETEPEESDLDIGADIAYGYIPLKNYSEDENVQFIMEYLKSHYNSMQNSLLQSVDILRLEGRKMNYKLYFKVNEETVKYIVFFEEEFQRVLHIRSFGFEIGGAYQAINEERMLTDPYFRACDKLAKQNHEQISEGAKIISSQWKIDGSWYSYRTLYSINGKTYHSSVKIHRESLEVEEEYWNEIIEIPSSSFDSEFIPTERAVKLTVADLNSNHKFSEIYNKVKQVHPELKNAQLFGAVSKSNIGSVVYDIYFIVGSSVYYSVKATYDVASHQKNVEQLRKIDLNGGFSGVQEGHGSEDVLKYLQKENSDISTGIVSNIGMKSDLMGTIWNIVVKLPTKFKSFTVLQQGTEFSLIKQSDEMSRPDSPILRPFPRPSLIATRD